MTVHRTTCTGADDNYNRTVPAKITVHLRSMTRTSTFGGTQNIYIKDHFVPTVIKNISVSKTGINTKIYTYRI